MANSPPNPLCFFAAGIKPTHRSCGDLLAAFAQETRKREVSGLVFGVGNVRVLERKLGEHPTDEQIARLVSTVTPEDIANVVSIISGDDGPAANPQENLTREARLSCGLPDEAAGAVAGTDPDGIVRRVRSPTGRESYPVDLSSAAAVGRKILEFTPPDQILPRVPSSTSVRSPRTPPTGQRSVLPPPSAPVKGATPARALGGAHRRMANFSPGGSSDCGYVVVCVLAD